MPVKIQGITEPPRTKYRTGAIGEAEARAAITVLENRTWVSDGETHTTRAMAAHRVQRMKHFLKVVEPKGTFTSKTWKEGKRYRWAIARKPKKASTK